MIHTGERSKSNNHMYSEKVKSPQNDTMTKIPTPKVHSHISASQPMHTSITHSHTVISSSQPEDTSSPRLRKRQLSTSPQNTITNLTSKNARVSRTFLE